MAQGSARELVVAALGDWRQGHRFADAILLERLAGTQLSAADRAFATELFYGVLRNLTLLDFWIGRLRSSSVDAASRDLLRLGLYQLFFLRTPGHAAVFETVALASAQRRSLVNAVLRAAQRQSTELETAARTASLSIRRSHPDFLVDRWTDAFGSSATETLCAWNNEPAAVYARINTLKITPEEFFRNYPSREPLAECANFVRLKKIPLEAIERGECYIQDASTRIACELLNPQPGEDVLDACAAPGGKTGYLAELMKNQGRLIACDRDASRVQTLQENLDRLCATIVRVFRHDWHSARTPDLDEPALFDRILLDAPCTNTGVMRRRVDVRWRLRPDDFTRMAGEQLQILGALVPLLKPGGCLVYSTCSLEREENEEVVAQARRDFPFLKLEEERTALPFRDGFDGAFAAKLTRVS